tara:strand:- start:2665 stop:2880 length:216 start_codon:yes stop_codon:yes gene_type:complete
MNKQLLRGFSINPIRIIYIIPELTIASVNQVRQYSQGSAFRTFCSVIGDILGAISIFLLGYIWLLTAAFFS